MTAAPRLSVVMPFYRNPTMLERQINCWNYEWSPALKAQVEIVIVDDASPEPAWPVINCRALDELPNIQLLRVKVDTPWHQHGARNLGAHVARGRWLLMTDMDHLIPSATLARALTREEEDAAYFFDRRDLGAAGQLTNQWPHMPQTVDRLGDPKPHVNSFALTRDMFWRVGGYDETYSGCYGTDSLFRRRLELHARRVDLSLPLIRVPREVIADASTTTLPRKEGRDPRAKAKIAAEKRRRGEADVVKTLQFEWERIL